MTEEELFGIMKKEFPLGEEVIFMLGIDHWHNNNQLGEYTNFQLSMLPGGKEECHIINSTTGWQDVYDKYLVWKENQDA